MRRLVQFDLTPEDIPPLKGHDWSKEVPYAAGMAHENIRVVQTGTWQRFRDATLLGFQMMTLANPDSVIEVEFKRGETGNVKNVIIRAVD